MASPLMASVTKVFEKKRMGRFVSIQTLHFIDNFSVFSWNPAELDWFFIFELNQTNSIESSQELFPSVS